MEINVIEFFKKEKQKVQHLVMLHVTKHPAYRTVHLVDKYLLNS